YLYTSFILFLRIDPPPIHLSSLSLHDALPISKLQSQPTHMHIDQVPHTEIHVPPHQLPKRVARKHLAWPAGECDKQAVFGRRQVDRKSTRLNSSHVAISYAVFCLKKKKKDTRT